MNALAQCCRFRMAHDRRGSVALELALVMPLMLVITLGFYEAYAYIRTVAMVERASASVANIMSRQLQPLRDCNSATDSLNLATYVDAAVRLVSPLPLSTQGEVILSAVSSVVNNNVNTPTVRWQRRSTFKLDKIVSGLGVEGARASLPQSLNALLVADPTVEVIVVEVTYRFTPFAMTANFWPGSPGTVTITRAGYFRSRTINQSTLVSAKSIGCTALPKPPA